MTKGLVVKRDYDSFFRAFLYYQFKISMFALLVVLVIVLMIGLFTGWQ